MPATRRRSKPDRWLLPGDTTVETAGKQCEEVQNDECRMQNEEGVCQPADRAIPPKLPSFCILHSAFCIFLPTRLLFTAPMTTLTATFPMAPATSTPAWWRPAVSLCQRELVRFLRQRSRVIGSLITPIMFWLFLGLGMQHSFKGAGETNGGGFTEYFFPGTILMILLFTAIFSTISIIEDRKEGFLQSVLVAPVSRMSIVLGKVLGGTVLAFGQSVLFLLLAPFAGIHLTVPGVIGALAIMLVLGFSLTSLGFCIAWRLTSTQGFHVIMNLFLLPMWMLSGALFPLSGAAGVAQIVMRLDPLTYGLAGLRRCLYWNDPSIAAAGLGYGACLPISVVFAAVLFVIASRIANKRVTADLL
jgi:ABC-2 type transport system permease protein